MSTSTDTPATDPGPPPAPPGAPTGSDRFFAWVRGLGVVRADGWLGGVCAGVAARIRIDPAIVRGVVVVAAVLGFPMLLVYAIAWALLPDIGGRIHFREALRGRADPAMVAIIILVALGFVPVAPWSGWMTPWWQAGTLSVIGWIVGLALVVGLVIVVARASKTASPSGSEAAAARTDPGSPEGADAETAADAAPSTPPAEPLPLSGEPATPRSPSGEHATTHGARRTMRGDAPRRMPTASLATRPGASARRRPRHSPQLRTTRAASVASPVPARVAHSWSQCSEWRWSLVRGRQCGTSRSIR
ncbi:PspC domain-containing protein [Microbacterium schleiferi]|uniref:PspC domain-containing protein n=1 Tax=Microbacterium schleiferi TaxID=69362 RepID=A0A7S8MYL8_9MICO|nr:PspC domain-containing protein [Microbacterium schleiferi]QPE05088.1 PspC domain-containing protein [Microbacterium schleiferi]